MASNIVLIACAILVMCCAMPSLATVYTVGDAAGWTTNVSYSTWTSGKIFAVGDILVFNYGGGHTVDEVSASDFTSCNVTNATSLFGSGTSSVTLNAPGARYFICGVSGHCSSGMKLTVTVGGAETPSPLPSPLPSPPPTGFNATTTPQSLSPSSTPSHSRIVSPSMVIILLIGVSLFKLFLS